jgi:hypothetical protein
MSMTSRSNFAPNEQVRFSKSVSLDRFEEALSEQYLRSGRSKTLLLDFELCHYIDIAVLINLISVYSRRKERRQTTFLGIPRDKRVRDFLRVWRYPQAFTEATGTLFEDALVEEDRRYRGETQTTYTGLGSGLAALTYDRDSIGTRRKRNFFEFTSYLLTPRQQSLFRGPVGAIPRLEAERWNNSLIREVLNTHLIAKDGADDVARVVIYESISNAVRHPEAQVIQTTSIFLLKDRSKESTSSFTTSRSGNLRIFVWDDGEAIADTLAPLIRNKRPVRAYQLDRFMYDKIYLELMAFGTTKQSTVIADQFDDPAHDAPEELILLSSLYPGITRTVAEAAQAVDPLVPDAPTELMNWVRQQGMGLYALTRTVLDLHQGSLLIRSGRHKLSIELAKDKYRKTGARYKSTVTTYPRTFPRFKGNLLIIQIPILNQ